MDNTLLTAFIAAGSACIGALIPSLFSYLAKRKEYENDRNAKLEEIRRKVYNEYVEALQTMVNNSTRTNFLPLQASTNKLLLFAGPQLSYEVNNYYKLIINQSQSNKLSSDKHAEHQTRIFNAMRKELGVSGAELEKVTMVSVGV